jgi:curved DNA-binding protein CbpA
MPIDPESNAYRILQVDPRAHETVIRAAYRALARLYHPDGNERNDKRMSDLNRAYDLIRDPDLRRHYDAQLAVGSTQPRQPVGPGPAAAAPTAAQSGGAFARHRNAGDAESKVIDFGRYAGWSVRDLVRTDPDYLRWLRRHSSGLRFRPEIDRLLPAERETVEAGSRNNR